MTSQIIKTCQTCKSEQVSCTAVAVWDIPGQQWVISQPIPDTGFCENCEKAQQLVNTFKQKAKPQVAPEHPYVVVCLDDDEHTTWISSHEYHCTAVKRYDALEAKYPNGSFDVWSRDEAINLPQTSFIF